ncbi:MAG: putative DNA binding domain-containing protein [Caldilineaceae bacterium]|nr:putative DNA binding domain-containing protein [Caldilineaceae bacterium]
MIARRRSGSSSAELRAALSGGEGEQTAFMTARASTANVAETLAALANANGGLLFAGVTSAGKIQARNDANALRDKITEAGLLTAPPLILPAPRRIVIDDAELAVVEVPSGLPHIYSLRGAYFTRTGKHNRPLTTPELRRLLLERGEAGFEEQLVPEATLDVLDDRLVDDYLEHIALAPDEGPIQALMARGCVDYRTDRTDRGGRPGAADVAPTVAGLLLFGRNPQQFVRSAEIICVRYAGKRMSDEFVRQDITGPLREQVRQAESFVSSNMRRGMRITGMTREETTEYPPAVVREAIVNAVAHRDYSIRGEGIRLLMFADRLEVYSPGRLPGHVTLDNLKDERYSRNEAVVAVLSDLGYIERLGYGIDRMLATMEEAGLQPPIFAETAAGFQVTLYSATEELVSSQPQEQPWPHGFLNPRQEAAMAFLSEHGRITNSDYQALTPDVSAETIRRDLADLVDKNILLRIGEKRATYYILK